MDYVPHDSKTESEVLTDSGEADEGESASSDDAKFLKEAHARFKLASEAERDMRDLALEDEKFVAGEQWPEEIKAARAKDNRPCLTINRMPQFIQQICNDQRQNRPSIKAHPVDDNGDVETGKVIQGMIRHIEYDSNADVAYDTGFESAVKSGRGFWRVRTEYESPLSFNQVIKIDRIRNPFSVFLDPYSQAPDGSDLNWGFIVDDLPPEEYKAQYPDSELAGNEAWSDVGNTAPDWIVDGKARVAEYFYKEQVETPIVLLSNGQVLEKSKLAEYVAKVQTAAQGAPLNLSVVQERNAMLPVIKWCKLNAVEVLEKTEWLGIYIPIIPVYGTERYIDGKRILEGVVRHAKDSQRMLNFWKSAETEAIALAPRTPWIAAEGQLEGHEEKWATANIRNYSVLEYKPISIGGTPVGPPQRNSFEPAIGAITQASMGAADDLKATTGIYDASLGGRSNETSGVAIQKRNQQAQTSNFHFVDNLTRSMKHTGRIVADLIPKIYDTERAQRIIGEDGSQEVKTINQSPNSEGVEIGKDGKPLLYDLQAGKYDVTMDVGPSYASKRQEAVASMLELSKSMPMVGQVAPDLILKSMDVPGAQEIAERLRKLPQLAQFIDDPEAKKKQPLPPEVQAQMQQMGQMLEQKSKDVADLLSERESRLIEIESKERIEMKKLEVQLEIKRAELDAQDARKLLDAEIAQINASQAQLHELIAGGGQVPPQDSAGFEASEGALEPEQFSPDQSLDGGMPADSGLEQPQPPQGQF